MSLKEDNLYDIPAVQIAGKFPNKTKRTEQTKPQQSLYQTKKKKEKSNLP